MLKQAFRFFQKNYIFVLVVILAAVLRFSWLSYAPPSLNWDEVSHGYNAYSILKTGKDEWGQFFPITNFRAYGDYPLPLNLYLTIPFVAAFGLNETAIRLPHVILGVLTVIATYFLVYGITKKRKISFLASFLVAIEPWYLFPSRFVLQSNLSVFFLIAAMAAFFNRNKNKYLLPLSFLFLGLTLFSYHTTRIFSPLLLLALFVIYKKDLVKTFKKGKVASFASIFFIILFLLPLPFILAKQEARARSKAVFLIDEGAVNKIVEKRVSSDLSPVLTKLIYNRPTYFAQEFFKNYFGYLSPQFLFLEGGTQYQFSIPGKGLLYLVNLPFFYLGLIILIQKALKRKKDYQLLLVWFLLSPIPASITQEKFAVLRSSTMLPLPAILTGLGLFYVWHFLKERKLSVSLLRFLVALYFIVLVASTENYLTTYFTEYRNDYSWAWQYGYKEVVHYTKEHYDEYDKIVTTKKYGEPHTFFLFYWSWDPEDFRNDQNLIRFYQSDWYWVDRFDKFYFVNDWEMPKTFDEDFVLESGGEISCVDKKCLLITSPGNFPKEWNKLQTINFLDDKPAFEIYEN